MRRVTAAGIVFAVLAATAFTDDYFRDEFYYLACARRLAWGYVDHPPLSIGLLWAVTRVFGESLLVLRVLAAAIAAGTVWLTGALTKRLGGSSFAEVVAMTAASMAPAMLGLASFYSMNVLEILTWTIAAYIVAGLVERPSKRGWIALGTVLGLGLLNKISVLWLGAGLAVGLVATAPRLLVTAGPWICGAIAALMFAPNVLWQRAHGWPTLEFMRGASEQKMQTNTPLAFLLDQVMNTHPFGAIVWIAGLSALIFGARLRRFRILAVIFLTVLAVLVINRTSRSGYLTAAYPMLWAAGGVALAGLGTTRVRRTLIIGVLAIGGLATMPLAVPILPVDRYVRYASALGVAPSTEEKHDVGRLPQFLADRHGWREMTSQVVAVWNRLTPEERGRAVVLAGNYGEAGALELLGRDAGVVTISAHNNYWLWGPGNHPVDVVLVLSRSRARLEPLFESVENAGDIRCGDCMPYENGLTIFIGRGLKIPLAALWPSLKHFD